MKARAANEGGRDLAGHALARALSSGVPLDADPALVRLLVRVDRGADVPPQLYTATACILEFAWSVAEELAGPAQLDR